MVRFCFSRFRLISLTLTSVNFDKGLLQDIVLFVSYMFCTANLITQNEKNIRAMEYLRRVLQNLMSRILAIFKICNCEFIDL